MYKGRVADLRLAERTLWMTPWNILKQYQGR